MGIYIVPFKDLRFNEEQYYAKKLNHAKKNLNYTLDIRKYLFKTSE